MDKCFCIQPFDGGKYDKRFDDIFKPAIEKAGLEPYRVDRDPTVNIPIEDIERGIKSSEICFADITTDNPNVWFELGYAIAVPKNVVLVCEERISKFPFDIQHRSIIKYKTDSTSDYEELKIKISERILALLKKEVEISNVKNISPVVDMEGLSPHEMVTLISIMQNSFTADDFVTGYTIRNDMNNAGYTDIATSIALRLLKQKGYINFRLDQDFNGNQYYAYEIEENGVNWLLKNQEKLVLQKEATELDETDNSLPF